MVRTPATLDGLPEVEKDICVNPDCEREIGLAGVFVAGKGRICGHCFRGVRTGIVMDENYEMSRIWRR